MLALRRVRFPSACSRRLVPISGIARRTNATTTTATPTGSSASSTPPPVAPKTKEILLNPTILNPKERRPDTLPKPKPKAKQESVVKAEEKQDGEAASGSTSASVETQKVQTKATRGRKRRVFVQRKRPQISTRNPRKWNRALQEGVVPAYDEALKVIYKDSRMLKKEAKEYRTEVKRKEAEVEAAKQGSEEKQALDAELESMRERLRILQVQSEINLPSVRWTVANAMGVSLFSRSFASSPWLSFWVSVMSTLPSAMFPTSNMRVPSHRYLVEQRWRKDGKLDLLMERIHQMNIVPDVLPVIHPSIDLDVTVKPPLNRTFVSPRRIFLVEPGKYLTPQQTLRPPMLFPHVYHTDTRLYTMLMIDPDVPDEENRTFTTYLHWMKPNIPLSATHRGPIPELNSHTTYIPPHPQRGTPYHRYTILLLPNPPKTSYGLNVEAKARRGVSTSESLDIPVVPDKERLGFNVREFVKQWGLNAALGGGYHMYRQVWDDTVTGIYGAVFGRPEPHYGLPRKQDPYAALRKQKKYV
ncbi:mitochondrial 54S ribosomal protein YmL35 [Marasmius tenuissimus]|uniref:Mitochondrial 54S ribosomal protein YmL35 n=1 Tax=Marasmius tenuissimus TaxID=585030 RepID=A0ABR2ZVT4_9AGAR